ncbi:MAG: RnfABCDGE type electron transport complex subunit D, partial [Phaeodactylibacter sp.]|nr:RnfABCDGE type electron transport complex subunit D [Phaeodactylibacter sp.]
MVNKPKITISTSPFLHDRVTTPKIMWELTYTLIPILMAAVYYFGLSALLVSFSCIAGCLVTEYYLGKRGPLGNPLRDGSAVVTGLLLALTLPPGFPLWMAFVGGVVAIGMGKVIWGGLGQNVFNPALVGRAFLQAAFPTAITTWEPPDGRYWGVRGTNLAMPFYQGEPVDALSTATPLSEMKFSHEPTALADLLLGNISGSLGETCALLLLLAGLYLAFRRIINWRIPVAILATVALFSSIVYLLAPDRYPSPGFMVLAGGLLLGTVYMATDPVSSPLTPKGIW